MLRITRQAGYGVLLLANFATEGERTIKSARGLSDATGLPLPTVTKILKLLAREGILASQRGVKGGYQLAGRLEDLSVGKVVEVLEGPIATTNCSPQGIGCELEERCATRSSWNEIDTKVRALLDNVSVKAMTQPKEAE